MKANSGLKKNRTKIQMVLTALVILSVVRQFFLGNYHFDGITAIPFPSTSEANVASFTWESKIAVPSDTL